MCFCVNEDVACFKLSETKPGNGDGFELRTLGAKTKQPCYLQEPLCCAAQ